LTDLESIKLQLQEKKNNLKLLDEKLKNENSFLEQKKKERQKIEKESEEFEDKVNKMENLEREKEKANLMMINKRTSITELQNQLQKLKIEVKEAKELFFDEKFYKEALNSIITSKEQEKKQQSNLIELSSKLNSLYERKKKQSS